MQSKILEEKDSKLLERKEIKLEVNFDKSTPSNLDMKKSIANIFKTSEELILIKKIHQHFGANKATVQANIYKDIEKLKKTEGIKEKKEKPAEAKPEAKKE